MRFNKKKKYKWEPVPCTVQTILDLLRQDIDTLELVIQYEGNDYNIGIASDYDARSKTFTDKVYYLNDREFSSFNAFCSSADMGGVPFERISETINVVEADEGNPRNLTIFENL
ncbi:hypothetical protein [Ethanoligenens sp.]|uniref:hypothetical protein n=1 Tax=Ethanoligenens sp. TaxID=2099655 RepID=UPI0039EAFDDB